MILNGSADMAIGDISVTLARSRVIDVTYPFHQEPVSFMLRRPPLLPRWVAIAAPFDATTWGVLAAALTIATLLFAAVPALSGGPAAIGGWTRLTNAGFVVWASITGQDQVPDPRHALGRCVALLWVVFSVIIGVYYQTMLVSKLSVPVYGRPVNSLEDLALSPFEVKSASGTAATVYLESFRGADTLFARLPEKMTLFPIEDLTSSTAPLDDKAAYVNELGHLQHALKDRKDRHLYYISRARFFQTGLAWPVRKGACFARRLNTSVMRLLQSGIVELWLSVARIRDRPEPAAPRALTVGDMAAALLVLTVGGAAATLVFVLELVLNQRSRRAQKEAWSRVSRRLTRAQAPWGQRAVREGTENGEDSAGPAPAVPSPERERY
ncbi:Glutamate receptor [Amphibalanus amphitrite]|uniref:Glutamate receptor n=1 Tax=Amphibalanus amphitrite TaxID=1232801 RepID=A0A6A4WFM3_AMPAM|nr:Glutamate receptor [Amphibalanus amphitrite]